MKNSLALTAIASALFMAAPAVNANEYVTLSNFGDSIELKKGETALVVSASDNLVVQYDKKGTWPLRRSQFRLTSRQPGGFATLNGRTLREKRTFVPTWKQPFPLSGPCKIKLVTSGVVGMRVVSE